MAPQTFPVQEGQVSIPAPDGIDTSAKANRYLGIPDPKPGDTNHLLLVFWAGHAFEVVEAEGYGLRGYSGNMRITASTKRDGDHRNLRGEWNMILYCPVDTRLKVSDIQHATIARPNKAGTHWLFFHTDEGTHHDYELSLLGAIEGVFQPYLRQLLVDYWSGGTETVRERAQLAYVELAKFYGDVIAEARKRARSLFLGQREQQAHPKEGWLDLDITNSVAATEKKWKAEGRQEYLDDLSGAITYVKTSLAMPKVETRWDREARLKREADAAAAGNGDSGAGH